MEDKGANESKMDKTMTRQLLSTGGRGALLRDGQSIAEVTYRIRVSQTLKQVQTTETQVLKGLVNGEVDFEVNGSEPDLHEGEELDLRLEDGRIIPVSVQGYIFGRGGLNLRAGAADVLLGYNPLK